MSIQWRAGLALAMAGAWFMTGWMVITAAEPELVPLPVKYPAPSRDNDSFGDLPSDPDFEKETGRAPEVPRVPKGVINVALTKPVMTSTNFTIECRPEQVTDGEKEVGDHTIVHMKKGLQWVQVDLLERYEIQAVVIWHDFLIRGTYFNQVIVQVADDPEFTKNVRTLFNNDRKNAAGLGVGKDLRYHETFYGRVIKGNGQPARYVRWYTKGSNISALNSRIEMEVWAVPAKAPAPAAK